MGEGREAQEGGNIYNSDWFVLLVYSTNQHNIAKQFSYNLKKKKKRKILVAPSLFKDKKVGVRNQWNSFPSSSRQ